MQHAHPEGGAAATQRTAFDIGDIFRRHGHDAIKAFVLTPRQERVVQSISDCRTAALGGHMEGCSLNCGFERPAYNSCRDRHCPKCQATRQAQWVVRRLERIVPVAHYHVVFTLPGQLRPFAAANPELAYSLLFHAASRTLMAFGHDPQWLGAQLGLTLVLHTWRRDLGFHPHVHCVVTAGGLSDDEQRWVTPQRATKFLFPVAALAKVFKGKFLDALNEHEPHTLRGLPSDPKVFERVLDRLHRIRWHVYAKRPLGGGEHLFKYLGRYTHRVAISNHRLIDVTDTSITFATKDGKRAELPPIEFIRRFLQHVLPKGFTKIRHYGLYAGANVEHRLAIARRLASGSNVVREPETKKAADDTVSQENILTMLFGPNFLACPVCKVGRMRPIGPIPAEPQARGPP